MITYLLNLTSGSPNPSPKEAQMLDSFFRTVFWFHQPQTRPAPGGRGGQRARAEAIVLADRKAKANPAKNFTASGASTHRVQP
jgi:hypothetical protein